MVALLPLLIFYCVVQCSAVRVVNCVGAAFGVPLANDDIRRDVLTTIMAKGMRGSNAIAAGAAVAAQKSLQELDRRRAVNLILNADDATSNDYSPPTFGEKEDFESARKKQSFQLNIGDAFSPSVDIESPAPPSEEDEAMEALRLLLIQNQVAHGELSEEEAIKVYAMRMPTIRNINSPIGASVDPMDRSEFIEIDAGDVDDRLKGCGPLPPAVLSALKNYAKIPLFGADLLSGNGGQRRRLVSTQHRQSDRCLDGICRE